MAASWNVSRKLLNYKTPITKDVASFALEDSTYLNLCSFWRKEKNIIKNS